MRFYYRENRAEIYRKSRKAPAPEQALPPRRPLKSPEKSSFEPQPGMIHYRNDSLQKCLCMKCLCRAKFSASHSSLSSRLD